MSKRHHPRRTSSSFTVPADIGNDRGDYSSTHVRLPKRLTRSEADELRQRHIDALRAQHEADQEKRQRAKRAQHYARLKYSPPDPAILRDIADLKAQQDNQAAPPQSSRSVSGAEYSDTGDGSIFGRQVVSGGIPGSRKRH
ncbi:hypothetical protein IEU95_09905 [Hoyosella rhizosphaerae]|uniref:hypothetical protein n=1 Tax=Hoyosella rhizosphaerae TaxID=1755582 RepID=UPI00166B6E58|nr:hypothetical protein [Hoyosella rhizosphaerae]MBN4927147.1 hypothetical protein [Hoyosella rhizosphaerae]